MEKTKKTAPHAQEIPEKTPFVRWLIWGCGGFFYLYQFILRASPSYMTEELMRDFHVHGLALGALVSFYYYAYAPVQIPLGLLLDKFGPRRVLLTLCALCVLGDLVFASANSLSMACAGRFLMGIGSAGAWIGSLKLITLYFPPHRTGTVIGATMFLGTMGPFLGGPLVARLVDQMGWRQAMYTLGLPGLFLLMGMFKFLRNGETSPSESSRHTGPTDDHRGNSVAAPSESFLTSLRHVFFLPQFWLNAGFAMLMYVPIAAFADLWGITFIQDLYHIEKPLAASMISSVFFGMSLGAFANTYFSDRIASRWIPMIIGACGSFITYGIVFYIPEIPVTFMYILMFLGGFFFTGQLLCFATAVEIVPLHLSGLSVGFTNMVVMLSGVIFQPFVGWLLDLSRSFSVDRSRTAPFYTIQDWRFALTSIMICLGLALFLLIFIHETHPKKKIVS